uniref:protein-serine/threonine phosphatase n=1 Tax=Spongospora subterranea TaxID=70186 RepID=A0A0H5RDB2_9EUKA|eukprot:CRZ06529.1 hypothetical protein [Spongospora subterranea]
MGLSHPVDCKVVQNFVKNGLVAGSASMQGYRPTMEDAMTVVLGLENHPNAYFFAIYDGHGGHEAAIFAKKEIVKKINLLKVIDEKGIRQAVAETDQEFLHHTNDQRKHGSCAIISIVNRVNDRYDVICANIGDSRIIIGSVPKNPGGKVSFNVLTEDHKPELEREKQRIIKAGGFVDSGRVDGTLAVSRALGDWLYKCDTSLLSSEQKVISVPEFSRGSLTSNDFLLLACDGIFESLNNETVASTVGRHLAETKFDDPSSTLVSLLDASLDAGSKDNMSGILITFAKKDRYSRKKRFVQSKLGRDITQLAPVQRKQFARAYCTFAKSEGFEKDAVEYLQLLDCEKSFIPKLKGKISGNVSHSRHRKRRPYDFLKMGIAVFIVFVAITLSLSVARNFEFMSI